MWGCTIQMVKVPPINLEKLLRSISINLGNFLKIIMLVNPEMPTHESRKCKNLLKTIPINLDSMMKMYPKNGTTPPMPWTNYLTPEHSLKVTFCCTVYFDCVASGLALLAQMSLSFYWGSLGENGLEVAHGSIMLQSRLINLRCMRFIDNCGVQHLQVEAGILCFQIISNRASWTRHPVPCNQCLKFQSFKPSNILFWRTSPVGALI